MSIRYADVWDTMYMYGYSIWFMHTLTLKFAYILHIPISLRAYLVFPGEITKILKINTQILSGFITWVSLDLYGVSAF